ncbi:MAG: bifunctional 3,4-dihydroxy-2-butanone-4-phosphate synthase/GTP cyclohydrolase II [Gemmatimonadetes bacterium]|nr:bifunctional 3,4-dihydroxy-2-butanone-4-phosphate synthase/GTP cyclohydrolase II [Gemmatimonadota bacterium]MBK8645946.1 bifunctional 3,4-dihydroxy-2-butanone-4-phosphate synthase/GTP cyclohydrolase II [Gemmatimonadota bacterium]MBK9407917.1 bifunctional 3,4-dihydroxy-2-butanone-4-phosphate synthase/GTP cyclohydrolase II [Gemmatimonadota bacterium]MBK9979061.1 bifunctional 3,4-dihydroxy-2-butanone-4-phosphate synthase/GTP cyclohydrolase II [Gemmatimonadota bacterium]MCC7322994.1 bifunctional
MAFGTVQQAIEDLRNGKFVVVADDEDRENEGDLICAAEMVTPEMVNFMLKAKGMICVALPSERVAHLGLSMQARENTESMKTAFTVSIDGAPKYGVSTGISASDRAITLRLAADPTKGAEDVRTPGHVHPLKARHGGVLQRVGHTEAAVDLCRLAGMQPAGVICEILNEDGRTMKRDELDAFAASHGLTFITVSDLVAHRLTNERLVHRAAEARLPNDLGGDGWRIVGYRNDVDDREHVALVYGDLGDGTNVLVRMHSKCLTGDVFHSRRCDCGWQLHKAMEMIAEEGKGVIVYLDQEGRGIGLLNKLRAYELQDQGHDTVEANEKLGFKSDLRNYGVGAQILLDLGITSIRMMTNNPMKLVGLKGYGLEIVDRVRIAAPSNEENASYLETKRTKMGHLLNT